jgi:hypothetical protein
LCTNIGEDETEDSQDSAGKRGRKKKAKQDENEPGELADGESPSVRDLAFKPASKKRKVPAEIIDDGNPLRCLHCGKVYRDRTRLLKHKSFIKRRDAKEKLAILEKMFEAEMNDEDDEVEQYYTGQASEQPERAPRKPAPKFLTEEEETSEAIRAVQMMTSSTAGDPIMTPRPEREDDVFEGLVGSDGNLLEVEWRVAGPQIRGQPAAERTFLGFFFFTFFFTSASLLFY